MFRNRTFKVLGNLILLAIFCTGQVSAAPNNKVNEVKRNSSSSNSSILINNALTHVPKISNQALMAAGGPFVPRCLPMVYREIRAPVPSSFYRWTLHCI